jgi:prevent-host-death family protein
LEPTLRSITARELKNRTGAALRAVRRGETLLVTFRGKPAAVVAPYQAAKAERQDVRSYEEAWADIELALKHGKPRFATWREAEDAVRGRR